MTPERALELHEELLQYARSPRYERVVAQQALRRGLQVDDLDPRDEAVFWDHLVLEHRLRNGRRILEQFLGTHPELSATDQELLESWTGRILGIFEVLSHERGALHVRNLLDDLEHVMHTRSEELLGLPVGCFVAGHALLLGGDYLAVGVMTRLPTARDAHQDAVRMLHQEPHHAYRNPALLAEALEYQAAAGAGSSWRASAASAAALPPHQARVAITRYLAAMRPEGAGEPEAFVLPPELQAARLVAISYDAARGLMFHSGYALAQEAFRDPALVDDGAHRRVLEHYLEDPHVPACLLQRLAAEHPEHVDEVLGRLLRRTEFSWEHEGEALLAAHKEAAEEPHVVVYSQRLLPYAQSLPS